MARSDGDGFEQNSFVNAISTPKGGTWLGQACRGRSGNIQRFHLNLLPSGLSDLGKAGSAGSILPTGGQCFNALGYFDPFRAVQKC